MEEPVEVIIVEPQETDLPLLEALGSNAAFRLSSVVGGGAGNLPAWFERRGVAAFDDLGSVARLLPGVMVVYLGSGLPGADIVERAASHGLSIVGRDVITHLVAQPLAERKGPASGDMIGRYRRLLADYFPTSRSSSTAVKLTACLTEATTIWRAAGGAVLTTVTGGTLAVAAQRGLDIPRDSAIKMDPTSPLLLSISRGKHEIFKDFPGELLPGVKAPSAVVVSIKSGTVVRGALLLWSGEPDAFSQDDVAGISLFAYYLAMLIEVDEMGDRLGENLVTDPLTGLHNRRQFEHRLGQELLRAKRYTLTLSLVVIDIDAFGKYNEACGQMLGNLALSDMASILIKGTREVDFVARIGGDEFALVLPETNRLGALQLTERLRSEVASYPFPLPEDVTSLNLTVSAGISNFPSAAGVDGDLLATAHIALDHARAQGPDTIKLWDEKLQE